MVARAQQPVPMVGLLALGKPEANAFRMDAVHEGLRGMGFVEGRNLAMQYRWADSYDRLPELAASLVNARVAVIISNSTNAALAAKQAPDSIPVVFVVGGDAHREFSAYDPTRTDCPGGNAYRHHAYLMRGVPT
jgi:putative tryptophan/tyrosine transport system substrate-binding protein